MFAWCATERAYLKLIGGVVIAVGSFAFWWTEWDVPRLVNIVIVIMTAAVLLPGSLLYLWQGVLGFAGRPAQQSSRLDNYQELLDFVALALAIGASLLHSGGARAAGVAYIGCWLLSYGVRDLLVPKHLALAIRWNIGGMLQAVATLYFVATLAITGALLWMRGIDPSEGSSDLLAALAVALKAF